MIEILNNGVLWTNQQTKNKILFKICEILRENLIVVDVGAHYEIRKLRLTRNENVIGIIWI